MGHFADAYAALAANPVPRRSLECLRRLANRLLDEGRADMLCALPLAGTLLLHPELGPQGEQQQQQQQQQPVLVELASEVAAALARRAHSSDLGARPQPYQVLYAFLARRGDFAGAAAAMLAYARRLRAEESPSPGALAEVLRGYGAALGALAQLPPGEAWLDCSSAILAPYAGPAGPAEQLLGADAAADGAGAASLDLSAQLSAAAVSVADLQREYLLFSAAARLWSSGGSSASPMARAAPREVFQGLLVAGLYDQAASLAQACFSGQQLGRAMEEVVRAAAAQCVRVQRRAAGGTGGDAGVGLDVWEQAPGGWPVWLRVRWPLAAAAGPGVHAVWAGAGCGWR
jgi:hypothetical protein